jgi:hypothetical protein
LHVPLSRRKEPPFRNNPGLVPADEFDFWIGSKRKLERASASERNAKTQGYKQGGSFSHLPGRRRPRAELLLIESDDETCARV